MSNPFKGKRVGVIMGGPSSEREVSLNSGRGVFAALQQKGYDAGIQRDLAAGAGSAALQGRTRAREPHDRSRRQLQHPQILPGATDG